MKTHLLVIAVLAAGAFGTSELWNERAQADAVLLERAVAVRSGTPTIVEKSISFDGRLEIETGDIATITAPVWEGLVTSVQTGSGEIVTDRTGVVRIDGVLRTVATTESPFYRQLAAGDTGDDVGQLQELLVRWGHLDELPTNPLHFHWRTKAAVRSLATEIGADPASVVFDHRWLIWASPGTSFEVDAQQFEVGASAPPGGSVILKSAPSVTNSKVLGDDDAEASLVGTWQLHVEDEQYEGVVLHSHDDSIAEDEVVELLRTGAENDALELSPLTAYSFPIAGESDAVQEFLSVPVASLRTDLTGSATCIFGRAHASQGWTAIPVSPSDAPGPNVLIDAENQAQMSEVLFNPSDVLEEPFCP